MLTIRSTCSLPVVDLQRVRARSSQRRRRALEGVARRAPDRAMARDHRPDARLVERPEARRVELAILRVLGVAEDEHDLLRLARLQLEPRPGAAPIGCQPWAIESPRSSRARRPAAGPSRGTARGTRRARCRSRPAARSRRSMRSGRAARGTRSCGRSRRPRRRPRRSSSCAGSSSRRRCASQRQNSIAPTSDSVAGSGRSLVTRVRQTSCVCPSGTK